MNNDNEIIDYGQFFFQGVVEARNDPLKLGRVKVRIIGLHTDDLEVLRVDELPWASILIPATESAPTGYGLSVSGIPPGTHVFGMFLDGINRQMPLILGSIKGIPRKPEDSPDRAGGKEDGQASGEGSYPPEKEEEELGVDFRRGFFDPNEEKISGYPRATRVKHPDTHRFLRLENGITKKENPETGNDFPNPYDLNIEQERHDFYLMNLSKAQDRTGQEEADPWLEPQSRKITEYPYSRTFESESGIGHEIDDTPYHERRHVFSLPSINYVEWATRNGYEFRRVWGDSYTVKHSGIHKTYIRGNETHSVMGHHRAIHGQAEVTETYDTAAKINYDSQKIRTIGQMNQQIGADYILQVNNDIRINANHSMTLDVGYKYRQTFQDTHHSVYWMRQQIWNEGDIHHVRKRNVYEKTNESHHSIVWFDRKEVTIHGGHHSTVAGSIFIKTGAIGGDFNHTVEKGSKYEKVEQESHFIAKKELTDVKQTHINSDTEKKKIAQTKHLIVESDSLNSISKNHIMIVGQNNNLHCVNSNTLVDSNKQTQVTNAYKIIVGKNLEEKVATHKIIQIQENFLKQFKTGVDRCKNWFVSSTLIKMITDSFEVVSKVTRMFMDSGALQTANDFSIKVGRNGAVVINGDCGVHVKGTLRIRADKGIFIRAGGKSVIGVQGELTVGSTSTYISRAPSITHVKGSVSLPSIDVTASDISNIDKTVPTVPNISPNTPQFTSPEAPEKPKNPKPPELPKLPKTDKAQNINNREFWEEEEKLTRNNEIETMTKLSALVKQKLKDD